MRNLKRALSLALAAVMLIGMMVVGASAASYNDFSDREEIVNKDAVSMLTTLGVIDGKPDGSFAPTEGVDRAMMAKMISVIMNQGVDNGALYENSPSGLTDIASSWAKGHINYCYTTGIIAGRGNGTFDPTAGVTGSEAAKMLLVAAGYDPAIEGLVGADWEMNTNALASKLGIFRNFTAPVTEPLTRDNAALLIYNALDVEMIESYTQNGYPLAYGDHRTILSFAYGVYKVEGVVVANEWAQLEETESYAALRTGKTTLDNVKIYGSSTSSTSAGQDYEEVKGTVQFNVTTPVDMLGKTVTMYIEKTTILSNSKVKGVSTADGVNVINTTAADQDTAEEYLKGTGVSIGEETEFYVNYGFCKDKAAARSIINENSNFDLKKDNDKFGLNGIEIEVIDNDDDGTAEYVLYTMETLSEVRSYSTKNETVSLYAPERDKNTNKLNGKAASFSRDFEDVVFEDEVTTDDLVLYVEYGGRTYISLPEIVTGQMTRVDRDKENELYITVEGEEYRQSFIPDAASKMDVDLTHFDVNELPSDNMVPFKTNYDFILDSTGEYVVAVRPAEETAPNYALVLESAWTQNALAYSGQVKILMVDGTEKTYTINWDASVRSAFGKGHDSDLENYLGTRDVLEGNQPNAAVGSVITYTVDDDDVLTIKSVLKQNRLDDSTGMVDKDNGTGNGINAGSDIAFIADTTDRNDDPLRYENLQWVLAEDYDNGDASLVLKADNGRDGDATEVTTNKNLTYAIDRNTVAFYYVDKDNYGVATGWDKMGDVDVKDADGKALDIAVQVYPVERKDADKTLQPSELAEVVLFNAATTASSRDYMLVLNRNAYTDDDELWLNVIFEDGTAKEIEIDNQGGYDFDRNSGDYMKAYAYVENSDGTYDIVAKSAINEADARLLHVGTVDQDDHAYWTLPDNTKVWDITDMESVKDEAVDSRFTFNDVNAVIIPTTVNGNIIRTAFVWEIPADSKPDGGNQEKFKNYVDENAETGELELYYHDKAPKANEVRELASRYLKENVRSARFIDSVWVVTTDNGDVYDIYPVQMFRITYNGKVVEYIRQGDADGVDFTTSKAYQNADANAVIINKNAVIAGTKDGGVTVTGNTANYTWEDIMYDVDLVDAFKVTLTGVTATAKSMDVNSGNFVADGIEVTLTGASADESYTVTIGTETTTLSGSTYTMAGKAVTFGKKSSVVETTADVEEAFKTQDTVKFDASGITGTDNVTVPDGKDLILKGMGTGNLVITVKDNGTLDISEVSSNIEYLTIKLEAGSDVKTAEGTLTGAFDWVSGSAVQTFDGTGTTVTLKNAEVYVISDVAIGANDKLQLDGSSKFAGGKDGVKLTFLGTPDSSLDRTNFYGDKTDDNADSAEVGAYVWGTYKADNGKSFTGWLKNA